MEPLDKLAKVMKVLKEMNCNTEKLIVTDAPDKRILVSVYYKNAHEVDKTVFEKLINDKKALMQIPEIILTGTGQIPNHEVFNIFY